MNNKERKESAKINKQHNKKMGSLLNKPLAVK